MFLGFTEHCLNAILFTLAGEYFHLLQQDHLSSMQIYLRLKVRANCYSCDLLKAMMGINLSDKYFLSTFYLFIKTF
jgi:hypothetical protein